MQAGLRSRAIAAVSMALLLAAGPAFAEDFDATYKAMVASAKADPRGIDYKKLREVYSQSSFYEGYDSEPANYLVPGQTFPREEIAAFVDANFALLSSHILALRKLGYPSGSPESEVHASAFEKVWEVIAQTGNGQSRQTAFKVLAVSEEYDFVEALGGKVTNQGFVEDGNAAFDLLTVTLESGRSASLWFDVSTLVHH